MSFMDVAFCANYFLANVLTSLAKRNKSTILLPKTHSQLSMNLMNETIWTLLISLAGSFAISFFVAKYYGERWVETRRSRIEHSNVLKDHFFIPWLKKISDFEKEYIKIDAKYSVEKGKMVPLKPKDPEDLEFFAEAMNHLKNYENLHRNWDYLKQETLKLNEELTILFEDIRVLASKEISIPYWCSSISRYKLDEYSGDKPDEYLCPNYFIRSIYDEIVTRIERDTKRFHGNGTVGSTTSGKKKLYYLNYSYYELAGSLNEELMQKAQRVLSRFIEDKNYQRRLRAFMNKKEETFDKKLEKVKEDIREIIKSIELGNIIKGKCSYCH